MFGENFSLLVPRTLCGKGVRDHVHSLLAGATAGLSVQVEGQMYTRHIPLLQALRGQGLALPLSPDAVTVLTVISVPSTTAAVVTWFRPFHYCPPLHGRVTRL